MPRISMTTAPPRKCGEPQRSKTMINKERTPISASDDPSHARASNLDDMKKKLAGTYGGGGKSGAGGGKHRRKKKGHKKSFRLPSLSQDGELVRQELKPKPINVQKSDQSLVEGGGETRAHREGNDGNQGEKTKQKHNDGGIKNALPPTKTLKAYAYFSKSLSHLQPPPLYTEIPTIGSYHIGIAMGVPTVPSNKSFHTRATTTTQAPPQQHQPQQLTQPPHNKQESPVKISGNSNAKYRPVRNPKLKLQHHEQKKPDRYFVYGPDGISVYSSA